MKTIWKFNVKITDSQEIEMPKGAKVLTVQMLAGHINLWAIVDTDAEKVKRTFHVYGTGNPLPEIDLMRQTRSYVGTVQQAEFYVWHVFEIA